MNRRGFLSIVPAGAAIAVVPEALSNEEIIGGLAVRHYDGYSVAEKNFFVLVNKGATEVIVGKEKVLLKAGDVLNLTHKIKIGHDATGGAGFR